MFNQEENERGIPAIFIIIVNENLYRNSRYVGMYLAEIYFIKESLSLLPVYIRFSHLQSHAYRLKY